MPSTTSRKNIDQPRLLICEGIRDAAFFQALIATRGLPNFCIRTTGDDGGASGNSGYEGFLRGVAAWPNFYNLQHIVVVADNDDNAANSFNDVISQIQSASPAATPAVSYGLPAAPEATAPGSPATMTVIMLPAAGALGTLETLCMQAATGAHAAACACVDQFAACIGSSTWSLNALSKMRASAFIAGKNRANPWAALQYIWQDDPTLFPLTDPCFDPLSSVLARF